MTAADCLPPMHKLNTVDIFSESPLAFASLGYLTPLNFAREFTAKDGHFPPVQAKLPQRLGRALRPSYKETQLNTNDYVTMDPLEEIVNASRFKIPQLQLNSRSIKEVLDRRPEKPAVAVNPTPKKRGISEINEGTPTASVLKRRKAVITDADMSCDISVEGFIGTDNILRMVDQSLVDTPVKSVLADPKVQCSAPGPSPRNGAPKYLYDEHGREHAPMAVQFNPFRVGNMPPPNWRSR